MSESPQNSDVDVSALAPTKTVRAAAGLATMTGFMTALGGVQTLISVTFLVAWAKPIPLVMVVVGLASMFAGTQLYRMRGWAALAACVCSVLILFGLSAWIWFAGSNGFVSCLTMLAPLGALGALILSILSLPECKRADAIRERLQDAGMDLGI